MTKPSVEDAVASQNFLNDKGISSLAASAGSDEAVERGKYLALATVVIGVIGALGVGLRPVYRQAFASRAAAEVAAKKTAQANVTAANADKLQLLVDRLNVLQASHRSRHPMWYGEVPAQMHDSAADGSPQQPLR